MFELVSDESDQKLGIGVHKKRRYSLLTEFFQGAVWHDSTHESFSVALSPNYSALAGLVPEAESQTVLPEFNAARGQLVFVGDYKSLNIVEETVDTLQHWYVNVLHRYGACHRYLMEHGNHYRLVQDETASAARYGDAIMQARNLLAFDMMNRDMPVEYENLVGRIMPVFLQALGFKSYYLDHDLSADGYNEVRFIVEDTAAFCIYKPLHGEGAAYLERYSYRDGDYHLSFSGEASGDVVRQQIFEWLKDAAIEQGAVQIQNPEDRFAELALNIRRERSVEQVPDIVAEEEQEKPQIILKGAGKPIKSGGNIVRLSDYRPQ